MANHHPLGYRPSGSRAPRTSWSCWHAALGPGTSSTSPTCRCNALVHDFDLDDPTPEVVIDLTEAKVWDSSAVATLDAVIARFAARGVQARLTGLCDHSAELHGRLSGQLAGAH